MASTIAPAIASGTRRGERPAAFRCGRICRHVKGEAHVVRMLKAFVRPFLDAAAQHRDERRGHVVSYRAEVWKILSEDRLRRAASSGALEGGRAGEHLVKNQTEREDISATVDASPRAVGEM